MAVVRRVMTGVEVKDVFDVLRDGRSYEKWVVGTRSIRAVDPGWPAAGTRIHYTIGYRPLRKDGETRSLLYEPDSRLQLEAVAWPAGTARIDLRAEPVRDGTLVTMDEHPNSGPGAVLHNPASEVLIRVRGAETLRRLERLARQARR